jgi:hypothetical protein
MDPKGRIFHLNEKRKMKENFSRKKEEKISNFLKNKYEKPL